MAEVSHKAQVKISCSDLNKEVEFFDQLGFKLQQVFPADNPRVMVLVGFDLVLSIEIGKAVSGLTLLLPNDPIQSNESMISPCGVLVQYIDDIKSKVVFPEQIEGIFTLFDEAESWVIGRAGMLYRDLIPSRLSGAVIASNIMIPEGGPVPDHVHYHSIQFQLIFCTKGWVKVVYEDQGEPFILTAGDCVTQPPGIRHRVLEASDGLEVVEIGLPAEHMTTLDDQMILPTGKSLPNRFYSDGSHQEQRFCYHQHSHASWHDLEGSGLLCSETTVESDSGGLAAVNVIKTDTAQTVNKTLPREHQNALRFYYLISGQATCYRAGLKDVHLNQRDSFVLPADHRVELSHFSDDFQCIEFIWLGD